MSECETHIDPAFSAHHIRMNVKRDILEKQITQANMTMPTLSIHTYEHRDTSARVGTHIQINPIHPQKTEKTSKMWQFRQKKINEAI